MNMPGEGETTTFATYAPATDQQEAAERHETTGVWSSGGTETVMLNKETDMEGYVEATYLTEVPALSVPFSDGYYEVRDGADVVYVSQAALSSLAVQAVRQMSAEELEELEAAIAVQWGALG